MLSKPSKMLWNKVLENNEILVRKGTNKIEYSNKFLTSPGHERTKLSVTKNIWRN